MNAKTIKVVDAEIPALMREVERDQEQSRMNEYVAFAKMAAEIGYKHCEQGASIQETMIFIENKVRGIK